MLIGPPYPCSITENFRGAQCKSRPMFTPCTSTTILSTTPVEAITTSWVIRMTRCCSSTLATNNVSGRGVFWIIMSTWDVPKSRPSSSPIAIKTILAVWTASTMLSRHRCAATRNSSRNWRAWSGQRRWSLSNRVRCSRPAAMWRCKPSSRLDTKWTTWRFTCEPIASCLRGIVCWVPRRQRCVILRAT